MFYVAAVNQLPCLDRFHYEAAQGWLMLGDAASALEEMQRLSPHARQCACVLELEWGIHAELGDWARAASVAAQIIALAPQREFGWVHRAYALRRMPGGGLECAWRALTPALELFPRSQTIAYNLACYAAQMGHLEEAWALFQRALSVARSAREVLCLALADSDLRPLWPRIRTVERS